MLNNIILFNFLSLFLLNIGDEAELDFQFKSPFKGELKGL